MIAPVAIPSAKPRYWRWFLAAIGLLTAMAAYRIWFLAFSCPFDLSGDEAHYWDWSRRPDWSYYSKGPLVAWIIAGSRAIFGNLSHGLVGTDEFAVRLPAVILSLLSGVGIFQLTHQIFRSAKLAFMVVAVTCTVPAFIVSGLLMTIDSPLICLWIWSLVTVERALRSGNTLWWVATGVLIALGILAKYNMLFIFPTVGLAMLTQPRFRQQFHSPGPYIGAFVGALGFLPIAIWNQQHDWVSFRHVAGQAGVAGGPTINVANIVEYVAGQVIVPGPFWFAAIIWSLIAFWTPTRPSSPASAADRTGSTPSIALLWFATITPWAIFLAFSPITKIQLNWPVLSVVIGIILAVAHVRDLLRGGIGARQRAARSIIAGGVAVGLAFFILIHNTWIVRPVLTRIAGAPSLTDPTPLFKFDPTARVQGWEALGRAVGEVWAAERAAGREPFIATDNYQLASEIAHYTPGNPIVYCMQAAMGQRQSQHDIWRPNPLLDAAVFVDRPVIYIGSYKVELHGRDNRAHPAMPGLRPVRRIVYPDDSSPVQLWSIFVCDAYKGFPPDAVTRSKF